MSAQVLYTERREHYTRSELEERRQSLSLSWARGAAFAVFAVLSFTVLVRASSPGRGLLLGMGLSFAVFLVLVVVHARVLRRERRFGALRTVNEEALARLARDWRHLPLPAPPEGALAAPPIARDLGLLGHASLYHLLGTAHSPPAKTAVVTALLAPSKHVEARQRAVEELGARLDLRQLLELATRPFEPTPTDCASFLAWAESEPWLRRHRSVLWLARTLTVATIGAVGAAIAGFVPAQVVLFLATINLVFGIAFTKVFRRIFDQVGGRENEFQLYGEALGVLCRPEAPWASAHLAELGRRLNPEGASVAVWMRRLHSAVEWADARHSALLHLPLMAFLLWDFHALSRLEHWQQAVGDQARAWLETLGEFELLAAFSTLLDEGADWCFPVVSAAEDRLTAEALGHPLLAQSVRVPNDVTVGPSGSFLLVTGSNMSGKSTLLRAIGVNVVLAQAGAPVCAKRFRLPVVRLGTSILVEDSLEDGVSFFMAELLRIRSIVGDSEDRERGGPTFYLLDEILRGTNSRERRIAVQRVLGHLLAAGAIGAVSTHDLELVGIPELAAACQPVHFRETLHAAGEGPRMTFDYQLRPGPATTANALVLLDLVGLTERNES